MVGNAWVRDVTIYEAASRTVRRAGKVRGRYAAAAVTENCTVVSYIDDGALWNAGYWRVKSIPHVDTAVGIVYTSGVVHIDDIDL